MFLFRMGLSFGLGLAPGRSGDATGTAPDPGTDPEPQPGQMDFSAPANSALILVLEDF